MKSIEEARALYKKGNITFERLHEIYMDNATDEEINKFFSAPVYDRAGIIEGKSQSEIDAEWNQLTTKHP